MSRRWSALYYNPQARPDVVSLPKDSTAGGNLMKKCLVIVLLVPILAGFAHAQSGTKKRRPFPYEYGGVVIGNYSANAGLSPVRFDRWLPPGQSTPAACATWTSDSR